MSHGCVPPRGNQSCIQSTRAQARAICSHWLSSRNRIGRLGVCRCFFMRSDSLQRIKMSAQWHGRRAVWRRRRNRYCPRKNDAGNLGEDNFSGHLPFMCHLSEIAGESRETSASPGRRPSNPIEMNSGFFRPFGEKMANGWLGP